MAVKIIQLKDMDGNVLLPQGYSASHDNDGNLFSDIYATIQLVNTKANNSEVVHLLTDETVTGLKTLNTSGEIALILKSSNLDSSTTPSSTQYGNYIESRDKNNTRIARVFTRIDTSGNNSIALQAWKGSTNYSISVDSAGNCTAVTPSSATDNTTRIATTAWVNSHNAVDTNLVHTSGDETVGGTKTFTGIPVLQRNSTDCRYRCKDTGYTRGDTVESNRNMGLRIFDGAGTEIGNFFTSALTNGYLRSSVWVRSPVVDSTSSGQIYVACNPDGTFLTGCPASDVNNSIVTTVNKSKASNGYFQLGNGMIVNWCTAAINNGGTWTFAKAFNNTNYVVVISPFGVPSNSTSDTNWLAFPLTKANGSCTIRVVDSDGTGGRNGTLQMFAIGY